MDPPPNPIGEAWQSLWLALGGGLLYALLDYFVLRLNASFAKGGKVFRIGVAMIVIGVAVSGLAWVYFAKANLSGTTTALYSSYAIRGVGALLLLVGIWQMLRKSLDSLP